MDEVQHAIDELNVLKNRLSSISLPDISIKIDRIISILKKEEKE